MAEKTLKEMLDINGDGKLDHQDVLQGFKNMLDVDGDGKIDPLEILGVCKQIIQCF